MKERFIMKFPRTITSRPLTYELIKDYDIKINILKGFITAGKEGRLLVEWEAEEGLFDRALDLVKREGVEVLPISNQITLDKEDCIHCGACTAVCFSSALDLDRPTWKLRFDPERCVACGLCAKACPLGLFKLEFGEL